MTDRKAYVCMEPYENTGAVIFAKSNIEARRFSANEFHDGELGGMSVKRAPWADKYGARHKIPVSVMIDHGWHFECCYSGIRMDSGLYEYGTDVWDDETKEYIEDKSFVGKEPVGFQESVCFASQEYADLWYEDQRQRKEFEEEWLNYYRGLVLKNFPDAVLINEERYGRREHIYSVEGSLGVRVVEQLTIPFSFPEMKHSVNMQLNRQPSTYSSIGPLFPGFYCANGDLEEFTKWSKEQKEK